MILDHNKNPRNYGDLPSHTHSSEGYNPLCGDHYHVYLIMDGDTIKDIHFAGTGCAISKASASVMTTLLKGKTRAQAEDLFKQFHDLVTSPVEQTPDEDALGKLAVFAGVREYPSRVKCASLAWHTMKAAVDKNGQAVSTE